jgi:HPt (histidine-containing phosphotransfer) domain-containing protein
MEQVRMGTMNDEPVEFAVLDELRGLQAPGEPDIVAEVIELFIDDSRRRVAAMGAALERGDAVALGHDAHGLKGSSANVGANRLRGLCEAVERLGKSKTLDGAAELLGELEREYAKVERCLTPLRRTAS